MCQWHVGLTPEDAANLPVPMVNLSDPVEAFAALPRRLFLDSSTLQNLLNYGEFIWENVEPPLNDRAHRAPGLLDELKALRAIFQVNERASFDMVLSDNSLQEVLDKGDSSYMRWALDVLSFWHDRIEEYRGQAFAGHGGELASRLDSPRFGYLSGKDRILLRDALLLECDAFLTMDNKLAKNAEHVRRIVGLQLLRPSAFWALLQPWAALYY
jgi:hypothetical protein